MWQYPSELRQLRIQYVVYRNAEKVVQWMVQNPLLHKKRRRRIKVDPRLFPLPFAPFQLFQSSVIIKLDFFNVSNQRPCQEDSHHLDAKSQDTTLHSD